MGAVDRFYPSRVRSIVITDIILIEIRFLGYILLLILYLGRSGLRFRRVTITVLWLVSDSRTEMRVVVLRLAVMVRIFAYQELLVITITLTTILRRAELS